MCVWFGYCSLEIFNVIWYILRRENMVTLGVLNGESIKNELESVHEFMKPFNPISDFFVENSKLSVTFRPNGLMKAVTLKGHDLTIPVHLNFVQ